MHTRNIVFLLTLACFVSCAYGRKSKLKCEEYGKYVYVEEDSPVLSRRAAKHNVSQCAIAVTPLVIGGVAAIPKEFPHMCVIGYAESPDAKKFEWKCGGTLISPNYVLTAAHCITSSDSKPQVVRMGEVNFSTEDETQIQNRKVKQIIIHPDYTPKTKYNDITLIELDEAVEFNAYVRPACLNLKEKLEEKKAVATGFGKTSFDASEGSDKLMKVPLTFIDNKECEKYFEAEKISGALANGITDNMICAGELSGGKDTCQGDSGGPLQIVLSKPYCMYSIVGVVSFGKFCGFANQPAIYTKVTHYLDWIEPLVWKD